MKSDASDSSLFHYTHKVVGKLGREKRKTGRQREIDMEQDIEREPARETDRQKQVEQGKEFHRVK